jgi:hypothetical protein
LKRVLLGLAGVLLLFLVGRAIVHALASDETKIRWLVEDMAKGFDETRMDPILVAFAEDFRDETSGADRRSLREGLAYLFLTAKDPATKAFPYRVEVAIRELAVDDAAPDSPTADCELDARFLDLRAGASDPTWEIAVTAHWVRGEYGWRIARSSYETRSGRILR